MDQKRTLASCKLTPSQARSALNARGLVVAEGPKQISPAAPSGHLVTDSRKVQPGDLFLAYRGVHADGHAHITAAAERGAQCIICEDAGALIDSQTVSWLQVRDARVAWAFLAAAAFGEPQQKLRLFGVTGTNGKTSTVWMLGELLRTAGVGCLTLGTLGAYYGREDWPLVHTTPDPDVLFAHLAHAVELGLECTAMEISSHALCQGKVAPLAFAGTAFTSFSRDHLDFHKNLDDYWQAKLSLFTRAHPAQTRQVFAANLPRPIDRSQLRGEVLTYREVATSEKTLKTDELTIEVHTMDATGSTLTLQLGGQKVSGKVPYFASHALQNFAAAYLLAVHAAGQWLPSTTWHLLRPVPGRLEQVYEPGGPMVLVDYAHTPDALEKTLAVLRPFCPGRLVAVFGCGGDRDRGKRPLMGAIAERLADRVILTSDNPRSEDPEKILADIRSGCQHPERLAMLVSRDQAIKTAIGTAKHGDVVLIAGKGHETDQIFADRTQPFDDRLVARQHLRSRAVAPQTTATKE